MSTPNWHIKNASRYFVLGLNHYTTQEEINENDWSQDLLDTLDYDQTQFDYECQKEYLQEELDRAGYTDEEKTKEFVYAGATFEICMKVQENEGYYEGSCLDYAAELKVYDREGYYVGSYDLEPSEYFDEDEVISEDFCNNKGMSRLQAKNIVKRIDKEFMQLVNELEQIFSKVCQEELFKAWQASNGEAGYNRVSEKLYKGAA